MASLPPDSVYLGLDIDNKFVLDQKTFDAMICGEEIRAMPMSLHKQNQFRFQNPGPGTIASLISNHMGDTGSRFLTHPLCHDDLLRLIQAYAGIRECPCQHCDSITETGDPVTWAIHDLWARFKVRANDEIYVPDFPYEAKSRRAYYMAAEQLNMYPLGRHNFHTPISFVKFFIQTKRWVCKTHHRRLVAKFDRNDYFDYWMDDHRDAFCCPCAQSKSSYDDEGYEQDQCKPTLLQTREHCAGFFTDPSFKIMKQQVFRDKALAVMQEKEPLYYRYLNYH